MIHLKKKNRVVITKQQQQNIKTITMCWIVIMIIVVVIVDGASFIPSVSRLSSIPKWITITENNKNNNNNNNNNIKSMTTQTQIPFTLPNYNVKKSILLLHSTASSHHYDENNNNSNNDDTEMDDETLLQTVSLSQLQDLCSQCSLIYKENESKIELLVKLRQHAQEQVSIDTKRRVKRKERVERGYDFSHEEEDDSKGEGSGVSRAKHKIVEGGNDDDNNKKTEEEEDELQGVFYYQAPPGFFTEAELNQTKTTPTFTSLPNRPGSSSAAAVDSKNNPITVPPPPPGKNGQDASNAGIQTVTTYSSSDRNDLTGMQTAQSIMDSSSSSLNDVTNNNNNNNKQLRPEDTLAAGPFGENTNPRQKKSATAKEMERAKEEVTELVACLLALTGAPAFVEEYYGGEENAFSSSSSSSDFVGFDPTRVPDSLLSPTSTTAKSLRAGEKDGEVLLQSILSDFEVRAVAHDGMAADDKRRGGGHYNEVRKVGAFLEGYRRAEVKRVARETITMLLDRLVTDGIRGLDEMLVGMTKSGSVASGGGGGGGSEGVGGNLAGETGELNDSLVSYLNEAIRTQEKKVQQLVGELDGSMERRTGNKKHHQNNAREEEDDYETNALWNVTTDEKGEIIESIDPNDPNVKKALWNELEENEKNNKSNNIQQQQQYQRTPPEMLLTLLSLLRDRIKAEAAFDGNDEKGRNLRVLAYCLRAETEEEREKLVGDYLGTSMDALDSFLELITSSIEYTESTTGALQPSQRNPLNLSLLKQIKDMVEDMKERMAWKASGISSTDSNSWQ